MTLTVAQLTKHVAMDFALMFVWLKLLQNQNNRKVSRTRCKLTMRENLQHTIITIIIPTMVVPITTMTQPITIITTPMDTTITHTHTATIIIAILRVVQLQQLY